MKDKKIFKIIQALKENNMFDDVNEVIIEDNYIFIPAIELLRDKDGEWINPTNATKS